MMEKRNSIYFDCKTGVSGDMVLGALLDLGVSAETLKKGLLKLNIGDFDIKIIEEEKYGVKGTNVYIKELEPFHEHNHENNNSEEKHIHRSYREIEKIIINSNFSEGIKTKAISIYKAIAQAESTVHETDIDNVHFHELGRNTAIFNIVGVAICLELLGAGNIYCSELHDGTGFVECSHGLIPIPVPAVKELLKNSGIKFVQEKENNEMVTPSGLGILK
ncbi:MAG: LarC family nickel insertion protein, partial [Peptostreptococcaceae bacterium]|nr:LarC family nickel insertion protein [Peptostreptococcaceae bacterium]